MGYKINKVIANRYNYGNKRNTSQIEYIVVHYTANDGDTAKNNALYFKNNITKTSAHYFVDSRYIYQSVEDVYTAYHCGGKKYYHPCRNLTSLGVELTDENKNGKSDFTESELNLAADLISNLMIKYGIGINNVIRHYDVTHKECPKPFTDNEFMWKAFKGRVMKKYFVKMIQSAIGTDVDGIAGSKTLAKTPTVSISKNNKHAVVRYIQQYLNYLGYDCGAVDGIAGNLFDKAVKKYQIEKVGLKVADGELTSGMTTWKRLLQ